MNCSCYIFANNDTSYIQYPFDNTNDIFRTGLKLCTGDQQLVVHREEQLMYYFFMQKLYGKTPMYAGVCVVLNDILVADIPGLYHLLERTMTKCAVNGTVLDFTKNGIRLKEKDFSKRSVELNRIFHDLMVDMNLMEGTISKLPPFKYEIDRTSSLQCELSDKNIVRNSFEYGYLVINSKDSGLDSSEVTSILEKIDEKRETDRLFKYKNVLSKKDKIIIILIVLIVVLVTIIILK